MRQTKIEGSKVLKLTMYEASSREVGVDTTSGQEDDVEDDEEEEVREDGFQSRVNILFPNSLFLHQDQNNSYSFPYCLRELWA